MGMIDVTYQGKTKRQHKIRVVWQVDVDHPDLHKPLLVHKRYTCSLDEKATLRKDLESWRGRPFTEDELNGFDLDVLIGVSCQLNVVQVQRGGDVYANVTSVVPLGRGMGKLAVKEYVRVQDRESSRPDDDRPPDPTDEWDTVPF
jgi:hypothetical protein